MALPRSAQRQVFRPARRVSWGTRIFAALVFLVALGAMAGVVILVIPAQVAGLSQSERQELSTAQLASAAVGSSVGTLWADMGGSGSLSLTDDHLQRDLTLAQSTEKAADDALAHVQLAQSLLTRIDAVPFQLHSSPLSGTDRPVLQHLQSALQGAIKASHGAALQLAIARHANQDAQLISGSLAASLAQHDWTTASRTAATVQQDLKSQQSAASDPEAFVDPLWNTWMDALAGYAASAQQFALSSAAGQASTAQQLSRAMSAASDRAGAALQSAEANTATWQKKTVQPLLDTFRSELAAAS